MSTNRELLLSMLSKGQEPLIFDEAGEFVEGNGMRITLLPNHILFEVSHGGGEGHIIVDIIDLLDALTTMTQKVGN